VYATNPIWASAPTPLRTTPFPTPFSNGAGFVRYIKRSRAAAMPERWGRHARLLTILALLVPRPVGARPWTGAAYSDSPGEMHVEHGEGLELLSRLVEQVSIEDHAEHAQPPAGIVYRESCPCPDDHHLSPKPAVGARGHPAARYSAPIVRN
jgi:hypothetical protein